MFGRNKTPSTANAVLLQLAADLERAATSLRRIAGETATPARPTSLDDLDNMTIDLAHLEADDDSPNGRGL